MNTPLANANVYTDFQGLSALKSQARKESPEAIEAVAKQFEGLFVQMMLKSMREASLGEGLFDNDQSRLYLDMFDQQLALDLTKGEGIGFSKMLVEQLGGAAKPAKREGELSMDRLLNRVRTLKAPVLPSQTPQAPAMASMGEEPQPLPKSAEVGPKLAETVSFDTPADFVTSLWPQAEDAAQKLGVAPEVLIAQAALETGWGKAILRDADQASSHNLFNIKADGRWQGERVVVDTLEYRDGSALRQKAAFRAYDSYADSFNDYVDFLQRSPRYSEALSQAGDAKGFIRELHKAGYATDPAYAEKVERIMDGELLGESVSQLKNGQDRPIG